MSAAGRSAATVYTLEPSHPPGGEVTATPPSRRPPAHATIRKDVHCGACWYNLNGLAFIGRCPECGTRYNAWNSVRAAERRDARKRKRYMRTITNVDIVPGALSWQAMGAFVMLVGATGAAVLVGWFLYRLLFK